MRFLLLLRCSAQGVGEASVSAGMTFVPAQLFVDPVFRGLLVERVIRRVDPFTWRASGPPLQLVEVGATVEVALQVYTPDDLPHVLLTDLRPAGERISIPCYMFYLIDSVC